MQEKVAGKAVAVEQEEGAGVGPGEGAGEGAGKEVGKVA